ncbi:MAG TPA: hypothetical protein VMH83_12250, partial [Candidatus Acidoferrum sp.]|nr:hypothetical protein [Candidatus Acidoferrum sp.]
WLLFFLQLSTFTYDLASRKRSWPDCGLANYWQKPRKGAAVDKTDGGKYAGKSGVFHFSRQWHRFC